MKVIGIDVGGTKIKAGVVEGGKIIRKVEVFTEAEKGRRRVLQNIIKAIQILDEKNVKGIGVGFAGPVDMKKGIVLMSPNIKVMEKFNLKKFLEKKFRKKTTIEHDVTASVIAEARYGAGKGYKNIVMIKIGTGVGAGIIIDGKVYRGAGNAGEIGHMSINNDGIKSTCCKNYGCFEEYVSIRGLQSAYGKNISPKEMAYRAEKGDKKAIEAYKKLGRDMGVGIVNIANILAPEVIIIGGGIAKSFNLFEKEMRKTIKERGFLKVKVVQAKLNDPGIIGASLLLNLP